MNLLISACLLNVPCRYDGDGAEAPALAALLRRRPDLHAVPICPEQLGGLATPRPPAERAGARVITCGGADVTDAYRRGAEAALALAGRLNCAAALLKARSPSCGSGAIYDGSFTHTRISGDGVTAARLKEAGIPVFDEEHLADLVRFAGGEEEA